MFETPITVVGRLVSDPKRRTVGAQDVVKFRLASNARRRAENGNWEPGDSLFVNVNCWGRLVTGVAATLKKGDAVIVVGNVYTSEYDDREGNRRSSVEVRATSVGPDLARCRARIDRIRQESEQPVTDVDDDAEAATEDDDAAQTAEGLPLTA